MEILSQILIISGFVFILFGVIGILKFHNFYSKILVAAKIDTVGFITIVIGLVIKHGLNFFSLKVLLLMGILIMVSPLAAHMIARSAYLSGYETESQSHDEEKDHKYSEEHI